MKKILAMLALCIAGVANAQIVVNANSTELGAASANQFLGGACNGGPQSAVFRALCATDIPVLPDTDIQLSTPQLGQTYQSGFNSTVAADIFTVAGTTNQITLTQGVGTYTWSLPSFVSINANATSPQTQVSGSVLQLTGADATASFLDFDTFGAAPTLLGRRADGTNGALSAVGASEAMNIFSGRAYDGSAYASSAQSAVQLLTSQVQTTAHHGAGIGFYTTTNNTTSNHQAVLINASGGIQCNNSSGTAPTGGDPGAGGINCSDVQVSGNSIAHGEFVKTVIVNAGTTTYTTGATTNTIHFRLQAAGGGGGGVASNAAGNGDVAGGGSAGGYCEKTVAVTPSTGYTTSLPTGGTGGANTGANGNAPSGDSTIQIGATTYTAKAGNGGLFTATGSALALVSGGANTAVSTNCDVNSAGDPGGWGIILGAGAGGRSGNGGSSPFGAGGVHRGTTGAGNNATGFGAGGGGALSGTGGAGETGGNGGDSILVVDEYQ